MKTFLNNYYNYPNTVILSSFRRTRTVPHRTIFIIKLEYGTVRVPLEFERITVNKFVLNVFKITKYSKKLDSFYGYDARIHKIFQKLIAYQLLTHNNLFLQAYLHPILKLHYVK